MAKMLDQPKYKIRVDPKASKKDPFRIYMTYTELTRHKLEPGTSCVLTNADDQRSFMAVAWYGEKDLDGSVIHISRAFQEMHDLRHVDRVTVKKLDESVKPARAVLLYELCSEDAARPASDPVESPTRLAGSIRQALSQKRIAVGLAVEIQDPAGSQSKRTFQVSHVTPAQSYRAIYTVGAETSIDFSAATPSLEPSNTSILALDGADIGGLEIEMSILRTSVKAYSAAYDETRYATQDLSLTGGIVIVGLRGTGKTLLLEKILKTDWKSSYRVERDDFSDKAARLNKMLEEALQNQPSVIAFDALETLGLSDLSREEAILNLFKSTNGKQVLVIGAITSIADLPARLRSFDAFGNHIKLPVPDTKARAEVLKIVCGKPKDCEDKTFDEVAGRTPWFVGADLMRLLQAANAAANVRTLRNTSDEVIRELQELRLKNTTIPQDKRILIKPALEDWERALARIRPSAMDAVIIETPVTRWSDIGGYRHLKRKLRFLIESHTTFASNWANVPFEPTKGVLLYGPPGCSKTMIAKAVATEMGFNFLAVKGAEVLNKYVGESERKIRELFETANTVNPSIIFFDEIDSIGTRTGQDGAASGTHTLTTLLNEMDGIEARKVFVLAATNRPDLLDPALMRPGRLDRHFLVDLPDADDRREILQSKVAGIPYAVEASLDWLTQETEGYSGAEVVGVVSEAFGLALEEHTESGQELVLRKSSFESALEGTKPQVTQEMVDYLRAWGKKQS